MINCTESSDLCIKMVMGHIAKNVHLSQHLIGSSAKKLGVVTSPFFLLIRHIAKFLEGCHIANKFFPLNQHTYL